MYSNHVNSWHSILKGKFSGEDGCLVLSGYYGKSVLINAGKVYSLFFLMIFITTFIQNFYQAIREYILYHRNMSDMGAGLLVLFAFIFVYGFGFLIVKSGMDMGKEDETRIDRILEKALDCKVEIEN